MSTPEQDSTSVRTKLVDTLRLDLVGPDNDHAYASELLPEPPTRWYLTGFLVPTDANIEQRFDETSTETIDAAVEAHGVDDANDPDRASARKSLLPSSMGVSVLVGGNTTRLEVDISWGDYDYEDPDGKDEPVVGEETNPQTAKDLDKDGEEADTEKLPRGWRRIPCDRHVSLPIPSQGKPTSTVKIPDSNGLLLVVSAREAKANGIPRGTIAVSIFLVNSRPPVDTYAYRTFAFQTRIIVANEAGFIPRADPRSGELEDEWDHRVADLQYRDVFEYAVGHGVSVAATEGEGKCKEIQTCWIPSAEVERVAPAQIPDVDLRMESLGAIDSAAMAESALLPLVDHYREWIQIQRLSLGGLNTQRLATAKEMLDETERAASRIEAGIRLLQDSDVLEAFRTANRVVARSARQRFAHSQGKLPSAVDTPTWRPFQLAYILMTMNGIVEPIHGDRDIVDLLFFPTGGGKTEAYLGLAAFTLVLRRLRNRDASGKPSIAASGVSVLMRYTLRLLTLDQLGRAAGLVCALELEREQRKDLLGEWPFEIGLWVGQAATPNRMGYRGDQTAAREYSAYTKTTRFQSNSNNPSPIPLEECPWCGTKFSRDSFRLIPNKIQPKDLRVHCVNHECDFSRDRDLPIVAVDEPIYRRLPCFMIATVDKFAALPWTGETGTLFGNVERYDKEGFYGPCTTGVGQAIPGGKLPPPELIIQDELHLISGPLGTVAGLYETVIDSLASRSIDGHMIRPKVIASTATVRRADSQIRALFGRSRVCVFPPPGPNRRDSFFANTLASSESPARLYIGIAAQGRSLKVVLLRAALALLSAGQKSWDDLGGQQSRPNPADPYLTLLGYFNSLRELGGSRRIIEDEVKTRLAHYGRRKRRQPIDDLFVSREIGYDVLELTSRVSTNDVAAAKRRLALGAKEAEGVDVALATNMISVGLDIVRLGLMVVLGQPKTCSEYIQSTSRVGRDPARPGLVVSLLNIHKPRDRSHFERFAAYHESFYRNVEATSVTPFSPRALDRALSAILVALCRQQVPSFTPPRGADQIQKSRTDLDVVAEHIAVRAREHRGGMSDIDKQDLYANVIHRCADLLDDWLKIGKQAQQQGSSLQYQKELPATTRRLLYDFLDPDLAGLHPIHKRFRANRSMRDVEPAVELAVQNLKDWGERG